MRYELSKNRAIEIFPYSRSRLLGKAAKPAAEQKISASESQLVTAIKEIKADHPFWGYRRVWARLKYRLGYRELNRKKVYRLMSEHKILAHQTKMGDHGSQPTAVSFMRECHVLDIEQVFTSYNNPKGNADTERVMRTLKEEFFWQKDWDDVFELTEKFKQFVAEDYNEQYPHSTLKYLSPNEFERRWAEKQATEIAPVAFSEVDEGLDARVNFETRELVAA